MDDMGLWAMSGDSLTPVGGPAGEPRAVVGTTSASGDVFEANLAAMTSLSADAIDRVRAVAPGDVPPAAYTPAGLPIVTVAGRPLDSGRDPVSVAERAAAAVQEGPIVLLGLGTGYLLDALHRRGIDVVAVVERADVLRAALAARDFRQALSKTAVVVLQDLHDLSRLAHLRARAGRVVVHGPSAAVTPELAALAERWDRLPVARRPRVLVVGPTAGGSLGVARSVAAAVAATGAESRFFDAAPFAQAQRAFGELSIDEAGTRVLQGQFTLLLGQAVVALAAEWRPDLVIALAQAPLTEPALNALRTMGARTAFWFVENIRVLPYWRQVCPFYDVVYVIQPTAVDRVSDAGARRVAYLPMACDTRVHRRIALHDSDRAKYGSPISFAGAPYLNRRHLLTSVADLGLKVWGDGWESTALAAALGARGRFDADQMVRIFSGSEINVNIHSADHVAGLDPEPDYVNPRTFELAACGAFQLVDRRDPLPDLFDDTELVTFSSARELRALCTHYLERPSEREEFAGRAALRAQRDHSYDRRVAVVLDQNLPPYLHVSPATAERTSLDDAIAAASSEAVLSIDEAILRIVADVRDTVTAR
jgi:spore maturation protein CgeB